MASTSTGIESEMSTSGKSNNQNGNGQNDLLIQGKIQTILSSKLNIINDTSMEKDFFSVSNHQSRLMELNQTIGESIQKILSEYYPSGYKFIICTQVIENKGQGGRAGLVSHWDEANDKVFKQVWSNDFVIGTVTAFVIKVVY